MKVLFTGGTGYLGRAFLRRARREQWDWQITSISRDEAKISRAAARYPEATFIKADVRNDPEELARIFRGQDLVIHMGANKLIDVGERSAFEVMRNNVVGSANVAEAAMRAGVQRVVGISTDKAVQPVNTYGTSKLMMERLFQEADTMSDTAFLCARYGNVVGSTISIVTYFRDQLAAEGKLRITDPSMTRFYMGANECIDTVLYAAREAAPGAVVIPRMHAMSTGQVAELVLEESLEATTRALIVGVRPGEKLHECLLHLQESVRVAADNGRYYELRPTVERGHHEPFEITSDKPPLGWLAGEEMLRLIADSEDV